MGWIEKLLQVFGHGFIKKERINIYRWVITDYNGLIKFVELVNGKFRTPKIDAGRGSQARLALHRLIDWLNANVPNCNLSKLPIDSNSLLNPPKGGSPPHWGGTSCPRRPRSELDFMTRMHIFLLNAQKKLPPPKVVVAVGFISNRTKKRLS
jgi:hypothetical protein